MVSLCAGSVYRRVCEESAHRWQRPSVDEFWIFSCECAMCTLTRSLATRCVAMILLAWIFVLQGGPALVTGVSLSIDLWYQRLYVYAFELISLYIYIVLLRCVSSCAHDNKQTYRMLDWTTGFFFVWHTGKRWNDVRWWCMSRPMLGPPHRVNYAL